MSFLEPSPCSWHCNWKCCWLKTGKVWGCLLAQKGKSGSRLPLKHFHTSAARIHISNPIYSEALAKLKMIFNFFIISHTFLGKSFYSHSRRPMLWTMFIYNKGVEGVGEISLFINIYIIKLCMRLAFSGANFIFTRVFPECDG